MRARITRRDDGRGIHGEDEACSSGGIRYLLETSDSLDGWEPVDGIAARQDAASTTGPANFGTHEVAVDLPSAGPKAFFRLRVEFP